MIADSLTPRNAAYNRNVSYQLFFGRHDYTLTPTTRLSLKASGSKRRPCTHHVTQVKRRLGCQVSDGTDDMLTKLTAFSKCMSQTIEGEEAQKLSAQLAAVLQLSQNRGRRFHDGFHPVSDSMDRLICHLKYQSKQTNHVKINEARLRHRLTGVTEARGDVFSASTKDFELRLVTTTLNSKQANGFSKTRICHRLYMYSMGTRRRSHITAFFSEETDYHQTTWLHPNILAYNQLPSDSQVFDLVREDDLSGFKRLLYFGEASVRDCDEEGRPLLFVSTANMQCCAC